jgi:transketolase
MKNKLDIPSSFFFHLMKKMQKDKNIILLTADQGAWALTEFEKKLKKQYFNIGVSEQNMIGLAAGLTKIGKKVIVYAISPFVTQRCFEQIKVDLCIAKIPVIIVGSGSTFTYAFHGPTHQAIEDIAVMRSLPNLDIINPCDNNSAKASVDIALKSKSPVYIKLDKGFFDDIYKSSKFNKGLKIIKKGKKIVIFSTGYMTQRAIELIKNLKKKKLKVTLVDVFKLKPFDKILAEKIISKSNLVVTLEEQNILGGLGSIISEVIAENEIRVKLIKFGINDNYARFYGDRNWLHNYHKIDIKNIEKNILKKINYKNGLRAKK